MEPFLKRLAREISPERGYAPDKTCVVLPNRRAGLFLKRYLAEGRSSPLWAPEVMSIEDFVFHLHGTGKAERLRLLMLFYRHYQQAISEGSETFSAFVRWAEPLLDDFNDLDFYLADPDDLFGYLSDARAIERWSPQDQEFTPFQEAYLRFYRSLATMYHGLRRETLAEGLAWPGLAAREVMQKVQTSGCNLPWEKICFAGLNALSPAEKGIIGALEREGRAETFWDADLYYLQNREQEAGMFLRDRWMAEGDRFRWAGDSLVSNAVQVTLSGIPGRVGQARKAGDILGGWLARGIPADERTAVVLADESLLLPVLNSLPREIGAINVTMGLPLKLSPATTFFTSWFALLEEAHVLHERQPRNELGYRMRSLLRLFSHPWASWLVPGAKDELLKIVNWAMDEARKTGRVVIRASHLHRVLSQYHDDGEVWKILFPVVALQPEVLLQAALRIVSIMRGSMHTAVSGEHSQEAPLGLEYLFALHQLLTRIQALRIDFSIPEDLPGVRLLFERLAAAQKLPLSGEPLQGLQIMGVLETRALDFDRIILISANEDILPAGRHISTFIPMDIRTQFGLPASKERTAVFAYHFWRLLQHPSEVHILYDTQEARMGSGEKSRFLLQMKHEWKERNPKLQLMEYQEGLMPEMDSIPILSLQKTEVSLRRVSEMAAAGLSASALSDYRACSLRFYLKRVLRLEDDIADPVEIGANIPGTLVHRALELLFKPYVGTQPGPLQVEAMLPRVLEATEQAFREAFSGRDHDSGRNYLLFQQAVELIRHFLRAESVRLASSTPLILALEQTLQAELPVQDSEGNILNRVRLKGKADRMERCGGRTRIIDYKTGKVEARELVFKDLERLSGAKGDKIFQLMFYELLYHLCHPEDEVEMMILSLRNLSADNLVLKGEAKAFDAEDRARFREYLGEMLRELLDPDEPFRQTEDAAHCRWCDFRDLCYRKSGSADQG
ncbi:MAG TPA: PD-(D/E)XK nuclease family protein [Bacteroidales bacterium]|nr:PD-(D/E)XK nuclease family protein [Bacteroidales bacterium]